MNENSKSLPNFINEFKKILTIYYKEVTTVAYVPKRPTIENHLKIYMCKLNLSSHVGCSYYFVQPIHT